VRWTQINCCWIATIVNNLRRFLVCGKPDGKLLPVGGRLETSHTQQTQCHAYRDSFGTPRTCTLHETPRPTTASGCICPNALPAGCLGHGSRSTNSGMIRCDLVLTRHDRRCSLLQKLQGISVIPCLGRLWSRPFVAGSHVNANRSLCNNTLDSFLLPPFLLGEFAGLHLVRT